MGEKEYGKITGGENRDILWRKRRQRVLRQNIMIAVRLLVLFLIGFVCGRCSAGWGHQKEMVQPQDDTVISGKSAPPGPDTLLKESPVSGIVVIDPGHGGDDPGSMVAPVWEKEINLQMALKLRDKLEERGVKVLMTRTDDETLSLAERAELANDNHADAFISIHQNSFDSAEVSGMEFFYNPYKEKGGDGSEELAGILEQTILSESNIKSRGLMANDGLKVLRVSTVPAVLIESGYLTNPTEQRNLLSDSYQDKLMDYIADGILEFLSQNKTTK